MNEQDNKGIIKETRIFRLLNVAGFITLTGLVFAMAAIFATLQEMPELSLVFLYLCIWCDRVDGIVARKLNMVSDFGAELDNLSDAIAFAAAPAIFIYAITRTLWTIPFALLITLAGVLRLARYSYAGLIERDGKKYFVGFPIPYTAGLLFFVWPFFRELNVTNLSIALSMFAVIVSWMLVSKIPVRKGGPFERWAFYVISPIILIYYLLCIMGIRLWHSGN